ncbi:MAG TPA: dihydrolipoamide succinyltransferase, partial [Rhodospirillales bacterium]|nr:dihydrolipoamide succinyltransferase [Rhodospirillales bacterium]
MATEIKVPNLGESVSEATVAKWFKSAGDPVAMDEPLVELETDKVTMEVNAPTAGTLAEIAAPTDAEVEVGALLGIIAEGPGAPAPKSEPKPAPEPTPAPAAAPPPAAAPASAAPASAAPALSPAVRKLVAEHGLNASAITGTGKD